MKINLLFFIVPFLQNLSMPSLMNTCKVQSQVQFGIHCIMLLITCGSGGTRTKLEGPEVLTIKDPLCCPESLRFP